MTEVMVWTSKRAWCERCETLWAGRDGNDRCETCLDPLMLASNQIIARYRFDGRWH